MSSVIELDSSDDDIVPVSLAPERENRSKKLLLLAKKHHIVPQLNKFIELAYNLESSDGMERIIHKNILPHYQQCDNIYKNSKDFSRFLIQLTDRLKLAPHRKFSILKDLCHNLKEHKLKKRVDLVTLDTKVSESIKRKSDLERPSKKPNNGVIINLDDDDKSIINIESDEETSKEKDHLTENKIIILDEEKENTTERDKNGNNLEPNLQKCPHSGHGWRVDYEKLLTPTEVTSLSAADNQEDLINKKIKEIEEDIYKYTIKIKQYEEAEVNNFGELSPYILCDKYKAHVIKLYEQLSELEGENYLIRKHKQVRLTVNEGHPPGPARQLETWLNNNAERGEPPFPDFEDVVKCVYKANQEDKLGWSTKQIFNEARTLLCQCGEALQKRRQKREWRDMLQAVDGDIFADPADTDPELRAKLERNKAIARKKEREIIQHYVELESKPKKSTVPVQRAETTTLVIGRQPNIVEPEKNIAFKNSTLPEKVANRIQFEDEQEGLIDQENQTHNLSNNDTDRSDVTSDVEIKNKVTESQQNEVKKDFTETARLVKRVSTEIKENLDNIANPDGDERHTVSMNRKEEKANFRQQYGSMETEKVRLEGSNTCNSTVIENSDEGRSSPVDRKPLLANFEPMDQSYEEVIKAMFESKDVESCFETTIFDIEENVVFIEISSSESEADDEKD